MKRSLAFIGIAASLAVSGFAEEYPAAKANNQFGLKTYQAVAKEKAAKENQFYSPISAYLALSMVEHGAAGATEKEMQSLLGHTDGANWIQRNKLLMATLRANDSATLEIANGLWASKRITMRGEYLTQMQKAYGAQVASADFGRQSDIDTINQWVKEKTHNKIDSIIDMPNPSLVAFLANATYFEAKWTLPFKAVGDFKQPFTREDGSTLEVPMMRDDREIRYAEEEGKYKAIELSYGESQEASMIVVLPEGPMEKYVAGLTEDSLDKTVGAVMAAKPSLVQMGLPKFEFATKMNLNTPLQGLGLNTLFTDLADLSRIADSLSVDTVIQKTFVKVYEEGTIAAAVTGVGVSVASIPPEPDHTFVADRPFFFMIRDNNTGAVLFMGTVMEPELK